MPLTSDQEKTKYTQYIQGVYKYNIGPIGDLFLSTDTAAG